MSKNLIEKRKKAKRRIFIESIMIILIVTSPFIFKMHEYVTNDPNASLSFLGFEIGKNGFKNVGVFIWVLIGKVVPLYLLLIWFFSCKHWWYHIILIPFIMYAFQIFETIYDSDNYIDTENLLWLLPVCMVIIPTVYFIRIKLIDKYVHGIDLEAMDVELKELKERERKRAEEKRKKIKV